MTQMRIEHHFPRIEHLQSLFGADPRRRLVDALVAAVAAGRNWAASAETEEVQALLPTDEARRFAAFTARIGARALPEPELSDEALRLASLLEMTADGLQREDMFVSSEADLLRRQAERLRVISDRFNAALDLLFVVRATADIEN